MPVPLMTILTNPESQSPQSARMVADLMLPESGAYVCVQVKSLLAMLQELVVLNSSHQPPVSDWPSLPSTPTTLRVVTSVVLGVCDGVAHLYDSVIWFVPCPAQGVSH